MKAYIIVLLKRNHLDIAGLLEGEEMVEIDIKETYHEAYKDKMKKKLYGLLREREKDYFSMAV